MESWSSLKISQSSYNYRKPLAVLKNTLGVGHISAEDSSGMLQYSIRSRKLLNTEIFTIFDRVPMLTAKYFDSQRVRNAYEVLEDSSLSPMQKQHKLIQIHQTKASQTTLAEQLSLLLLLLF